MTSPPLRTVRAEMVLLRADIEAMCEDPEQTPLRMSPQFLLAFLGTRFTRQSDGWTVWLDQVSMLTDGTLMPTFRYEAPE